MRADFVAHVTQMSHVLQESLEKKNENHIRAFESIMNAYLKKNTDRMNKLKLTIMKSVIRKKLKLATNIIVDPRDYKGIMSLMTKKTKVDDLNSGKNSTVKKDRDKYLYIVEYIGN
mgnify:CR=1 FL=1|tara:strand:- start:887 stop:1234 length:348 start_codon:yes stop_codon:yes gene_type:complete